MCDSFQTKYQENTHLNLNWVFLGFKNMEPVITKITKAPTFLGLGTLNFVCLQLDICVTKTAEWNLDFRFFVGLPDLPKFDGSYFSNLKTWLAAFAIGWTINITISRFYLQNCRSKEWKGCQIFGNTARLVVNTDNAYVFAF